MQTIILAVLGAVDDLVDVVVDIVAVTRLPRRLLLTSASVRRCIVHFQSVVRSNAVWIESHSVVISCVLKIWRKSLQLFIKERVRGREIEREREGECARIKNYELSTMVSNLASKARSGKIFIRYKFFSDEIFMLPSAINGTTD